MPLNAAYVQSVNLITKEVHIMQRHETIRGPAHNHTVLFTVLKNRMFLKLTE